MTRTRGTGSLELRGRLWRAIWYDAQGRKCSASTGTANRAAAEKFLRQRLAEADRGEAHEAAAKTLTFEDLHGLLVADYEARGQRLRAVRSAWQRLAEVFAGEPAMRITEDRLEAYRDKRLKEGYRPATVKQDLAILRRSFRLALLRRKIARVPVFPPVFVGDNARQGTFTPEEVDRVCGHLPAHLMAPVRFAAITGWRFASEVLALRWSEVDLDEGWVFLRPFATKNKEPRAYPMGAHPDLRALLVEQRARADRVEAATGVPVAHVFFRETGPRRGCRIADYSAAFRRAAAAAGLAGRVVHDLRRYAVMNLERAGVPRSVAQRLTGHKTAAVYTRYAIPEAGDLTAAVKRLASGSSPERPQSGAMAGHLRLSK